MSDGSLIKVSPGLISALGRGQLGLDVFGREIVVLECLVAGTSFRKLQDIEGSLVPGARLELAREPKNEFDGWAIALSFESHKVGYIPRDKNEVLARLMDAGKRFFATIDSRDLEGSWLRIGIRVLMKD